MKEYVWPVNHLRINTPRLQLRLATDAEAGQLASDSVGRLLLPEQAHWFQEDWTQVPSPHFERSFLQHHWLHKVNWQLDSWAMNLTVFLDQAAIGQMSVASDGFLGRRSIGTGSWLLPEYRRRGYGREMRAAVLKFGFAKLGAQEFSSRAHRSNPASFAVSLGLGYKLNGTDSHREPADMQCFLLSRADWSDDVPVKVKGFKKCRAMFLGEE